MTCPTSLSSRCASAADLLDDLGDVPCFARDRYLTVVLANRAARQMSAAFVPGENLARYAFLAPGPRTGGDGTRETLTTVVGLLRDSLEEHEPDDRFRALVGELAAKSPAFAEFWADEAWTPQHQGVLSCLETTRVLGYREVRIVDDSDLTVVILSRQPED